MNQQRKIIIIGGGAAGFFAALSAKSHNPQAAVTILEKSAKLLAKVKVSGGGRCNVTNATFDNVELSKFYPRGEKQLKKAFYQFNAQDTVDWFESRGIKLRTYPDNCIFPQANDSQVIIDCFLKEANQLGIEIKIQSPVLQLEESEKGFLVKTANQTYEADKVIVTIGGQPKQSGFSFLNNLNLDFIHPVPSLFTFNMPGNPIRDLMGNVVEETVVKIEGTKLIAQGPLLVTHWGMSGPAILKLSAWGARILEEKNYEFNVFVNWLNGRSENDFIEDLISLKRLNGSKKLINANPFPITSKLWQFLLQKVEISSEVRWNEVEGKIQNKLVRAMLFDTYAVKGKTTFKEEFVTAGGLDLKEVDFNTLATRKHPNLFFAGESLNIDGITGGFNFQAAWTTGFIAGKSAALL